MGLVDGEVETVALLESVDDDMDIVGAMAEGAVLHEYVCNGWTNVSRCSLSPFRATRWTHAVAIYRFRSMRLI